MLYLLVLLWFFGEVSSNGCRPPVTTGVSWWSALIGGCWSQQTSMERLNRLVVTRHCESSRPIEYESVVWVGCKENGSLHEAMQKYGQQAVNSIFCDLCQHWIHTSCIQMNQDTLDVCSTDKTLAVRCLVLRNAADRRFVIGYASKVDFISILLVVLFDRLIFLFAL